MVNYVRAMTTEHNEVTYHFNVAPPESTHQSALRILKTKDGRHFVGKMKKASVKQWETLWRIELRKQRPAKPIAKGVPVRLVVALFYTPPASRPCKDIEWKVTKPDADNVVKAMIDCMVDEGYMETDQQVVDLRVMKMEWDRGGFVEVIAGISKPFLPRG